MEGEAGLHDTGPGSDRQPMTASRPSRGKGAGQARNGQPTDGRPSNGNQRTRSQPAEKQPIGKPAAGKQATRDRATSEPATSDQPAADQASGDQARSNQAAGDQGTGDHGANQGSSGKSETGDAGTRHPAGLELPDLSKLARDWITLWQSELSAMATDPEIHESWQTMVSLWGGTMAAMLRGLPRDPRTSPHDRPSGGAPPTDAPGPAPAAAAPDARDAEIERLARHVTALERRLAKLERGDDPAVDPDSRPGRKRRR